MGIQMDVPFAQLTNAPHQSLSFILEDMERARRDSRFTPLGELQAWVNVLKDWSAPLTSATARRGIEEWLAAVEAEGI